MEKSHGLIGRETVNRRLVTNGGFRDRLGKPEHEFRSGGSPPAGLDGG